ARILRANKHKQIMLIAHSMGSIIAYDALHLVARDVPIHTFITIGSPLGTPMVRNEILDEQRELNISNPHLSTPENIQHNWFNFADPDDKIVAHYELFKDYQPNTKGVQVLTKLITSNYEYLGIKNPHQSFGYLRSPELALVVHDFLAGGKLSLLSKLKESIIKKFTKRPR
ncbi:MAG: hypothetical protein GF384_00425, partial [Elusimicrobia bacterium]|nr:hypothetical protein [Elusimicrobiota bacterium]MBD3411559.1 hypothetical protein [Elusimicrobiota bacterium]